MIDIALSDNGDLIFGANRDLATVSDLEVTKQRMRLRVKVPRGSWIFDETGSLGSTVYDALGAKGGRALAEIATAARQAIDEMPDVAIKNIQAQQDPVGGSVQLVVEFSQMNQADDADEELADTSTDIITLLA